jgi:hypothetical protein
MDTVDLVLLLLALLFVSTIACACLAWRYRRAMLKAQREVVLLVSATRQSVAGYDTGLVERPA